MFIPHHPLNIQVVLFSLLFSFSAQVKPNGKTYAYSTSNQPSIDFNCCSFFIWKIPKRICQAKNLWWHVTIDDVDLQIYNIMKMHNRLRRVCVCAQWIYEICLELFSFFIFPFIWLLILLEIWFSLLFFFINESRCQIFNKRRPISNAEQFSFGSVPTRNLVYNFIALWDYIIIYFHFSEKLNFSTINWNWNIDEQSFFFQVYYFIEWRLLLLTCPAFRIFFKSRNRFFLLYFIIEWESLVNFWLNQ